MHLLKNKEESLRELDASLKKQEVAIRKSSNYIPQIKGLFGEEEDEYLLDDYLHENKENIRLRKN